MLHGELRQAIADHGLTQAELARRAGIPRERLRQLLTGGNVTLETLKKVLAQLPRLERVTIEGVDFVCAAGSVAEMRRMAEAWVAAGQRVLALLDAARGVAPAGATEVKPEPRVSPELELRLRMLEEQVAKMGGQGEH